VVLPRTASCDSQGGLPRASAAAAYEHSQRALSQFLFICVDGCRRPVSKVTRHFSCHAWYQRIIMSSLGCPCEAHLPAAWQQACPQCRLAMGAWQACWLASRASEWGLQQGQERVEHTGQHQGPADGPHNHSCTTAGRQQAHRQQRQHQQRWQY